MSKWYESNEHYTRIILSSRIRLARNFENYNFMPQLSEEDANQMTGEFVEKFLSDSDGSYKAIFMKDCSDVRKKSLKEKKIIGSYFLKENTGAVIVSEDEGLEIMVNAQDHIRIQALSNGEDISECLDRANQIDDYIDEHFDYAYDKKYGYKTTYPTNMGTGMSASYTAHLPALTEHKKISKIAAEIGRFGIKLTPLYPHNDIAMGDLYQISTQKSLGNTEEGIIKDLDEVVQQIVYQEDELREANYEKNSILAEDVAYKSYGLLKYARKLSIEAAMNLLSQVMLGVATGVLFTDGGSLVPFNKMIMDIQPSVINACSNSSLSVEETDVIRANYLRKNLPGLV